MAQGTAVYGLQLQALLAEPDVVALLERTPEARALLRPLCRMLAVPVPEALRAPGWAPRVTRVRRRVRRRVPGGESWPGVKAWRAKWATVMAVERARAAARGPPFDGLVCEDA